MLEKIIEIVKIKIKIKKKVNELVKRMLPTSENILIKLLRAKRVKVWVNDP
jgi:hypothetical protein